MGAPKLKQAAKARILALLEAGISVREVARRCNVDRRTVQRLHARFREQSQAAQDRFEVPLQKLNIDVLMY